MRSEQLDERKVGRQQRVDFTTLSVVVVFLVAAFFFPNSYSNTTAASS